jgi:hypothetical protein
MENFLSGNGINCSKLKADKMKNKLVIAIFSALTIVIVAQAALIVTMWNQMNTNNSSFTVWTDLTYDGSTPLGFFNTTAYHPEFNTTRTQSDFQTLYTYSFTVNSNTLTLMQIQDHTATLIPDWNSPVINFSNTKINATSWRLQLIYNLTGPSYFSTPDPRFGSGQLLPASTPPLSQDQLNRINEDFRSQNA